MRVIRLAVPYSLPFLFACCVASAQPPDAPLAFEVASVKPSDPAQSIAIKRSGYHLSTTSTSLEMLLTWAYDIHSDRLYGKPAWLDAVRYDVVANAPQGGTLHREPEEVGPLQRMMQTLLAERFKLAVHREIRQLPMYALVVAKSGPKVLLADPPESMGLNPFSMPSRGRLIGKQVTAAMLANVLSGQLGCSVQDRTDLHGVFDFTLEWEPDTQSEAAVDPPPGVRTRPSLSSALQEQLGFKLETHKGPVEVLVIDHIERTPTDN